MFFWPLYLESYFGTFIHEQLDNKLNHISNSVTTVMFYTVFAF
ncbi:hypothetical protein BRLA_c022290 [Brevibacillus laterosporus LMG 15441]|uniref:Uncharacterized protein n=1 Tax=Brevibacillus laterosporus LMG 15441 TaxID=1042163 RepID=A0A075RAH7_BRELA|nr:hypothetical protein BRLA_c022290 [Brevibacillus laterosporus LMG 15441]